MSFYVIPPAGTVSVELFQQLAVKRAKFLRCVYAQENCLSALKSLIEHELSATEYGDCLIEGSAKDVISHFTLRLACCADKVASQIFVACESLLFRYRLNTLSESQLLRFLRRFNRLRHHFLTVLTSTSDADDICEFLSTVGNHSVDWSQIVDCYNVGCHGCLRCKMMIPFRFVPRLVAQRSVTLHAGKASVSSRHLVDLLVAVFEAWLEYGMRMAVRCRRIAVAGDSRLKVIFSQCKNTLKGGSGSFNEVSDMNRLLRRSDIDSVAKYFPPCMAQLHAKLRQNHRLKHMSRVAYTLFLKSLGLPLDEALVFWREEYSLEAPCSSSYSGCRHSWHQDARRYIYSIRHLYGLEGRRANYPSFGCRFIQNHHWGSNEEGGCPFKNASHAYVRNLLQCNKSSDWKQVEAFVLKRQYSAACLTYLHCMTNVNVSHLTAISKVSSSGNSLNDVCDSGYDSLQSDSSSITGNTDMKWTVKRSAAETRDASADNNGTVCCRSATALTLCGVEGQDFVELPPLSDIENTAVIDEHTAVTSPVDYYQAYVQLLGGLQSVHSSNAGLRP